MEEIATRAEAERLLGIAEKLLQTRDLVPARDFAVLAQETAPLLDGSDLILAISDVLLAADKRINNQNDWYAILQLDSSSDDLDLLKKQYRRLALLLHPDKNKFPFAHDAFQLVADAWAVFSDPIKKSLYDSRIYTPLLRTQNQFPQHHKQSRNDLGTYHKTPIRKSSFWTACPYCYHLYEYPRVYLDCCMKCHSCGRAIHAAEIPSLPPIVEGKEAYYCCWGFFPMGFKGDNDGGLGKTGFPNWMPPMYGKNVANGGANEEGFVNVPVNMEKQNGKVTPVPKPGARKRGRPRKNPSLVGKNYSM